MTRAQLEAELASLEDEAEECDDLDECALIAEEIEELVEALDKREEQLMWAMSAL